jgi:ferredoxin
MIDAWFACPYCFVVFATPDPSKPPAKCPACAKPFGPLNDSGGPLWDADARRNSLAPGFGPVGASTGPLWYYARNQQPIGPVSSPQLKALAEARVLVPADMVLKVGTQKWVSARKVKGLFPQQPEAGPNDGELSLDPTCPAQTLEDFSYRQEALSEAQVVPESGRCVQCGICSYNCPMEIDVRAHAWQGKPIHDSYCLTCSECVKRCPRGVLRFERIPLFTLK